MTDGTDQCAEIIPFPHYLSPPIDAATKLNRAVRALDEANAELRNNISDWRRSIDALTVSLGEITGSLQVLDTELTTISVQLQRPSETVLHVWTSGNRGGGIGHP